MGSFPCSGGDTTTECTFVSIGGGSAAALCGAANTAASCGRCAALSATEHSWKHRATGIWRSARWW